MQVLALVTLWPGPIAPGEQAEVPDEQAQALIARGLASALPGDAPAFNPPAGKPGLPPQRLPPPQRRKSRRRALRWCKPCPCPPSPPRKPVPTRLS